MILKHPGSTYTLFVIGLYWDTTVHLQSADCTKSEIYLTKKVIIEVIYIVFTSTYQYQYHWLNIY